MASKSRGTRMASEKGGALALVRRVRRRLGGRHFCICTEGTRGEETQAIRVDPAAMAGAFYKPKPLPAASIGRDSGGGASLHLEQDDPLHFDAMEGVYHPLFEHAMEGVYHPLFEVFVSVRGTVFTRLLPQKRNKNTNNNLSSPIARPCHVSVAFRVV